MQALRTGTRVGGALRAQPPATSRQPCTPLLPARQQQQPLLLRSRLTCLSQPTGSNHEHLAPSKAAAPTRQEEEQVAAVATQAAAGGGDAAAVAPPPPPFKWGACACAFTRPHARVCVLARLFPPMPATTPMLLRTPQQQHHHHHHHTPQQHVSMPMRARARAV